MLHPHTELRWINEHVGRGVVATRPIPAGTITWVRDELDQVLPVDQVAALPPELRQVIDVWGYVNGSGQWVLCWDHGRFVNHSCRPTAVAAGYEFDVAVTDIGVGEQITNDYAALNLDRRFDCACGESGCRGTVGPGEFETLVEVWDGMVRAVLGRILEVDQPLWALVREQAELAEVIGGRRPMASCRVHCRTPPAG